MRRPLLAALAVALCCAAPAAAAPTFNGVQISPIQAGVSSPEQIDRDLRAAKGLKVNTVRSEVEWSSFEPDAKGVYDESYLALVDLLVANANALGMKPTLLVESSPCWASSYKGKGDCSAPAARKTARIWPPDRAQDFADLAGFLAARYAGRLAAIEIWNEPDHVNQFYFAGPDKPQRYAALLRAAYRSIKAADRNVLVLGGSLVGANGKFLRALYKAGIKGSYDALSVHYYDLVLASLRAIRKVQRANRDSKPLWLGEFGWTSCAARRSRQGGHTCVSPTQQGRNLVDIFRALRSTRVVKGAVVFGLYDTNQYDFGLLTAGFDRKPAYSALASMLPVAKGRSKVSLKLRRSRGRLYASGSGPAGDAFELDVYQGRSKRYKAVFRLDRRGRFKLRVPASVARKGWRVKVYQYWTKRSASKRITR